MNLGNVLVIITAIWLAIAFGFIMWIGFPWLPMIMLVLLVLLWISD